MGKLDPATAPVARRFVLPERLRNVGQSYSGLAALLLIILYDILFRPHFLQVQSLYNDLQEVAPVEIIATGMTQVIATGGIDLSVGSLMAFAGALAPIIFLAPRYARHRTHHRRRRRQRRPPPRNRGTLRRAWRR
jgi:ABC-type xylose transport system permease subunit